MTWRNTVDEDAVGLWLARGFLATIAVAAIAWGGVCLPVFVDQIRLDATRDLIIRTIPLRDEELMGLAPMLDRSAQRQHCVPAVDRSAAFIRLRMLENSFTPENHALIDDRMTALDGAIRKSLGCAPADPFLWLVLFWERNAREGYSAANLDLLRMSYSLGPNEGWIVRKRSQLALAMFDALPPDLAADVVAEFARLVKVELYTEAMEILAGPGWRYRDRLMASLADVPKQNVAILVKAMSDVGYDLGARAGPERRH